jgi:hypothetical protein
MAYRKLLIENLPAELHNAVKRYPEPRLRKQMDLLRDRLRLPSDLNDFKYFFTTPEIDDPK